MNNLEACMYLCTLSMSLIHRKQQEEVAKKKGHEKEGKDNWKGACSTNGGAEKRNRNCSKLLKDWCTA